MPCSCSRKQFEGDPRKGLSDTGAKFFAFLAAAQWAQGRSGLSAIGLARAPVWMLWAGCLCSVFVARATPPRPAARVPVRTRWGGAFRDPLDPIFTSLPPKHRRSSRERLPFRYPNTHIRKLCDPLDTFKAL